MADCRVASPVHILPLYGRLCALHLAAERFGLHPHDVRLGHLRALEPAVQLALDLDAA